MADKGENKTSAAQLAASRRYMAKAVDKFTVSARRGSRERWQAAADAAGANSLNAWIVSTLDAAAEKND